MTDREKLKLAVYQKQMLASPDQQISLTDPDSRSMATNGRGCGVVGYNVPGRRGYRAPSGCDARGNQQRLRSGATGHYDEHRSAR
jgi:hypothetical protein